MWGTLVLLLLLVALVAAIPAWPYSRAWSYVPSGLITAALIALLVLALLGYLTLWYPWAPAAY